MRKLRRKKTNRSASAPAVTTIVVMRLYIANNAPNSVRAIANLEAICKEHLKDHFKLEIIDVLEYPLRALADGILVTPSLAKMSPSPPAKIVGNLSDKSSVLHALGIVESIK
jgi:circadian clock protein KaiB